MLDEIDRQILWHIDLDARISVTDLAKQLGLSKQVVSYRLQRLTANEYILKQIAVIDIHRLGLLTFRVYVRLASSKPSEVKELLQFLKKHKHTLFVGYFSGAWDIEAVFTARNFIHFSEMFTELRRSYGSLLYRYDISMTPVVQLFRRDYLLAKPRKYAPLKTYGGEPVYGAWDELDFQILEALSVDSTISYDELGDRLKTAGNTVKARIKKLSDAKIISGYRTAINSSKLGRTYMKALLKLSPLSAVKEKAFLTACAAPSCTVYLTEVLGSWQLELEAEVENRGELDSVISSLRAKFPGVIIDFDILVVTEELKLNYLPAGKTAREIIRSNMIS